jgi:hypothetical protein
MNKNSRTKPIRSKISLPNQYYRQSIGNHTNWQDRRQGSQQDQDNRVQRLSRQPGLHSGNIHQRNVANAMVQLAAILSSVQDTDSTPVSKRSKSEKSSTEVKTTMQPAYINGSSQLTEQVTFSQSGFTNKNFFYRGSSKHNSIAIVSNTSSKIPGTSRFRYKELPFVLPENIISIDPENKYKASSVRKKRSLVNIENIPYQLYGIKDRLPIGSELRGVFDIVLEQSLNSQKYLQSHEADKNIFVLIGCIEKIYCFLKNNNLPDDKGILFDLMEIIDNVDPYGENDYLMELNEKIFLDSTGDSLHKISDPRTSNITQQENFCNRLNRGTPIKKEDIIHNEQSKQLSELLKKHGFAEDKSQSFSLVNNLVHYLSGENSNERINTVAKILALRLGMYDSAKEELSPDKSKMAFIAMYMNQEILGMSLDEWCITHLQFIKLYNQFLLHHEHMEYRLNHLINSSTNKGKLSLEAHEFYKNNVLKKSLPTLTLQLSPKESQELRNMDITKPRWGFIHAGAMLLNDSGANITGLTLTDIEDIGITLNVMLREGIMPQEYVGYFRLPALLHYTRAMHLPNLSMMNEQDMQQIFLSYFDYINKWENKNNPLIQLPILVKNWKTRTKMARKILRDHHMDPDRWLTTYLNTHDEINFEHTGWVAGVAPIDHLRSMDPTYEPPQAALPNIDKVFEEQNLKLADAAYEVDKLMLPKVFNSLSEDEQRFIEQSKVDRVRIQFNAQDSIYGVPLSPYSRMGMQQSGALIYQIPESIDLLQCTLNEVERIYALETSKDTGKYMLNCVNRDREALLWLLDDSTVPRRDEDYKLRVTSHSTLKEQADTPQKLIENLAEYHKKKLLIELDNRGYDKTTQEKVGDILLSLIPFYTCISEGIKGNEQEATFACMVDVLSLGVPIGRAAYVGSRFGIALGRSGEMALRYGARQATIRQMFKQAGNEFIRHTPLIKQEISPQVIRGLSTEFLNGLDPGFDLFISGGAKGIHALKNVFSKIPNKSSGMARLSDALSKNSAHLSSASQNKNLKIESLFSPAYDKFLDVAVIGEESGKQIWSRVNRETGKFFGEKFIRNADGNLAIVKVRLRHRNLKPKSKGKLQEVPEISNASGNKPGKVSLIEFNGPSYSGQVVKCEISNSNYIQYYAKFPNNEKGSEVLVLSAHGGFYNADMAAPAVVLPSDITIKMLTPHATQLIDPGLDTLINYGQDLRTYVTITNNQITNVDFLPQKESSMWKFSNSYNPKSDINTLGREDGLQNYRHEHYELESEELISKVLIKNKYLSVDDKAPLTDILTVRSEVSELDAPLKEASVQKVIDLDSAGMLLNGKGERYKTIVFCHCRANLLEADDTLSSYFIDPWRLRFQWPDFMLEHSFTSNIEMTILHRKDVNKAFEISYYTIGSFIFLPVKQTIQSIATQSTVQ